MKCPTFSDDLLLLNISAEISGDDWVGLGFSEDSAMGDDDVVAVVPSNKSYTVLSLYNSNGMLCVFCNCSFLFPFVGVK